MPKTTKLLIVIIILALALAYFFWRDGKITQCPQNNLGTSSCTSPYAPNTWKTWTDNYYSKDAGTYFGYAIQYPRDFDVYSGDRASGNLLQGTPLVKISFPQDAFEEPKTNFGEAYITISMATDTQAIVNCYFLPSFGGEQELATTTIINDIQFRAGHFTDAAAGSLYDSQVYRTIYENRCLEVIQTVHTGNIANYPEGTVSEFDKSRATSILDKMLQTLKIYNKPLASHSGRNL